MKNPRSGLAGITVAVAFSIALGSCQLDELLTPTAPADLSSEPTSVPPPDPVPSRLAFAARPSTAKEGKDIKPPVVVRVYDNAGGVAADYNGEITLTLAPNPDSARLEGERKIKAVAGVATFARLRVNDEGGPYRIVATAAGLPPVTSDQFAVIDD